MIGLILVAKQPVSPGTGLGTTRCINSAVDFGRWYDKAHILTIR